MTEKTREYLRYLSTLAVGAGLCGATTAIAGEPVVSGEHAATADTAQTPVLAEDGVARNDWYYQAWPESTFVRIRPPTVIGEDAPDVDFEALLAEVEQA